MENINTSATWALSQPTMETKSSLGQTAWILWIVFGICGILVLAIIFFPLTVVMAGIAIWKKNYLLGIVSVILAIVIFATSPSLLWAIIAIKNFYHPTGPQTVAESTNTEMY